MQAAFIFDSTMSAKLPAETAVYLRGTRDHTVQVAGHEVHYIKVPGYVKFGDHLINFFVRKLLKITDVPEYLNMLRFVYFSHMAAFYLLQNDYEHLLFASDELKQKVLLQTKQAAAYTARATVIA
ncbi:hypothetical protein MK904_12875 [Loigolactobacillus coryniformis]|uniref:hypothetical protein n=1 Tax=Loigolactobacillus coryniformis TaxID=1610 RepID=UPI0023426A33|nr:hypothetical protein [Loigolactobacillus coryniformis]MDC4186966.1 hypothetical protein [Loigolactobacillus coryniformis]